MTKKQLLFIASFAFMLGCNQNGVVGLESGKTLHSLSADNNAIIDFFLDLLPQSRLTT